MKLKVEKYEPHPLNYHMCVDEAGQKHRVDLFVNGTMPKGETHESVVGKVVECEYIIPYEEIAMNVYGIIK